MCSEVASRALESRGPDGLPRGVHALPKAEDGRAEERPRLGFEPEAPDCGSLADGRAREPTRASRFHDEPAALTHDPNP